MFAKKSIAPAPVATAAAKQGEQAPKQLISKATAKHIFGNEPYDSEMEDLNKCLEMFKINTPQRMRHFLSQVAKESNGLRDMKEIGDYDYFTENYEWREDLGNIYPGDGAKFAGAGPIQTTGRHNYTRLSEFVNDPKVIELGQDYVAKKYAFVASGFWWHDNNMNALCDRPDVTVEMVTRRVNGGINGLSDRIEYYKKACDVI